MDTHEIAVTMLSVPGAANYAEDKEAVESSRRINEALAEIVAKHLKRFGAIATLPGKTIDGSLSKMEYVLDTLKMDGVSTLTSVEDIYLGDSRFDPWFEEMNRRKPVEPARIGRRLRAPGFRTLPPESSEPCS